MKRSRAILRLLQAAQVIASVIMTGMMIKAMKLLYVFLGGKSAF